MSIFWVSLSTEGPGIPCAGASYRVRRALAFLSFDDCSAADVLIDAPSLLRVFIPIAHALSGIPSELTDRALATIEEAEPAFRERMIAEAKRWDNDEDWDWSA